MNINVQLSFEIFRLPRTEKGASNLSFCFKCPDAGTVRILGNILHTVWNFCHWVADVPPDETSLATRSKKKRLYSQARLSKTADNRSKNINMNSEKSVKKNRNPIRLCILPFYTIIFTTPSKSVQIVAWLSQNHRTTNPARELHIIWQRPLSSLFPFHRAPRAFFFFLPSLRAKQRGLCDGHYPPLLPLLSM